MDTKKGIFEKASDIFDLPREVLTDIPKLTITGCKRVHIENHKGILEYDEKRIKVNGGRVAVVVTGAELDIISMNSDELLLGGVIDNVGFEY